jgi:F-box domain
MDALNEDVLCIILELLPIRDRVTMLCTSKTFQHCAKRVTTSMELSIDGKCIEIDNQLRCREALYSEFPQILAKTFNRLNKLTVQIVRHTVSGELCTLVNNIVAFNPNIRKIELNLISSSQLLTDLSPLVLERTTKLVLPWIDAEGTVVHVFRPPLIRVLSRMVNLCEISAFPRTVPLMIDVLDGMEFHLKHLSSIELTEEALGCQKFESFLKKYGRQIMKINVWPCLSLAKFAIHSAQLRFAKELHLLQRLDATKMIPPHVYRDIAKNCTEVRSLTLSTHADMTEFNAILEGVTQFRRLHTLRLALSGPGRIKKTGPLSLQQLSACQGLVNFELNVINEDTCKIDLGLCLENCPSLESLKLQTVTGFMELSFTQPPCGSRLRSLNLRVISPKCFESTVWLTALIESSPWLSRIELHSVIGFNIMTHMMEVANKCKTRLPRRILMTCNGTSQHCILVRGCVARDVSEAAT